MASIPAVPISAEVVFTAAAEVFGISVKTLRSLRGVGSHDDAAGARDCCAWVMSQISDAPELAIAADLGGRTIGWYRQATRRCEMMRNVSIDYSMLCDAVLGTCYGIGRRGLGNAVSRIDALGEARNMTYDPVRAVKAAPVAVMAAIVDQFVDQSDVLQLVRSWLVMRDEVFLTGDAEAAGIERALAAQVRDALGLPDERLAVEEHAA